MIDKIDKIRMEGHTNVFVLTASLLKQESMVVKSYIVHFEPKLKRCARLRTAKVNTICGFSIVAGTV